MPAPLDGDSRELAVAARADALVVEDRHGTEAEIPVDPPDDADRPVTTAYAHSVGTGAERLTVTFATDAAAAAAHARALVDTADGADGWLAEPPSSVSLVLHEAAVEGDGTTVDAVEHVDGVVVASPGDVLAVTFDEEVGIETEAVGERESGRGR